MEFGKTRRIGDTLGALNLSTVCWIITRVNFGVARFGANRARTLANQIRRKQALASPAIGIVPGGRGLRAPRERLRAAFSDCLRTLGFLRKLVRCARDGR